MGKVVKLDDWRVSRHDRAVKKQRRTHLMQKFNEFLKKADIFFEKAGTKRELQLNGEQETHL